MYLGNHGCQACWPRQQALNGQERLLRLECCSKGCNVLLFPDRTTCAFLADQVGYVTVLASESCLRQTVVTRWPTLQLMVSNGNAHKFKVSQVCFDRLASSCSTACSLSVLLPSIHITDACGRGRLWNGGRPWSLNALSTRLMALHTCGKCMLITILQEWRVHQGISMGGATAFASLQCQVSRLRA